MKTRPTIALACILKNEGPNIGPFLESISGCFDAIYMTDTGSTDNSVDLLLSAKAKEVAQCPIYVSKFTWCEDFAKARQFSFDQVAPEFDYIMWLDLDDALGNKEAFLHFRDHTMHCADFWLANYNYAYGENGEPVCTFLRERIVRQGMNFQWHFFLHEGIVQDFSRGVKTQMISTWTVNHRRTLEDLKKDGGRNLRVFEANRHCEPWHPRMRYYYGKELYDAQRFLECVDVLKTLIATAADQLEPHDRVMAIQYLSMALAACGKFPESLQIALQGLQVAPERAEFWILLGDCNVKLNRLAQAVPFYEGAKMCSASAVGGLTFTDPQARLVYPYLQLAQVFHALGNLTLMRAQGEHLVQIGHPMGGQIIAQSEQLLSLSQPPEAKDLLQTEDVVITCPPESIIKDWDETVLKEKGLGGSETAAIEIAKWIKLKTGRTVKVFQPRTMAETMPSGVEYLPVTMIKDYFFKYMPRVHIAWRHAARLTPAKSYVWSHDLLTTGADDTSKYDVFLALSEFHREFVNDMHQIPREKVQLISNGINPDDFCSGVEKVSNKIIFSSSPDRGLERCIEIVKRLRDEFPDVTLHVFYGFDNLRKLGRGAEADRWESIIREHEFVKYHGMVSKKELIRHFQEACVWLYPADFIETFCITALEAMAAHAYPVVRNMGALRNTLQYALEAGECEMLDVNASSEREHDIWAKVVSQVLREKRWEKMTAYPEMFSWEKAAEGFIELMEL